MLWPPLLSTWDGLLRHQSTLHRTPPPVFVHRAGAADCKVRGTAPALGGLRPQQAPPPESRGTPVVRTPSLTISSSPLPLYQTPPPAASIPLLGPVLSCPSAPGPELTAETGEPARRFHRFSALSVRNWAQGQPVPVLEALPEGFFEGETPQTSPIPSHTWFRTWAPRPGDAGSSLRSAMCPQKSAGIPVSRVTVDNGQGHGRGLCEQGNGNRITKGVLAFRAPHDL